jgi:protein-disulfide isomerase
MNRILFLGVVLTFLLSGCTSLNKKIADLEATVKKLEARLEAIEKLIAPHKEEHAKQEAAYDVPVGNSPVLGNKDAPVHIVVFSNFQCPYCARADKTLREIIKDPSLDGKVNLVFKQFPFDRHPEARPASKAALAAAEQGKFWEMSEKIFSHQNDMNQKNYEIWAKEVKLNVEKWKKDLKDNDAKYNAIIDEEIKLGEKAHLQGTPWILVNGWQFQDDLNAAGINKLIMEKNMMP